MMILRCVPLIALICAPGLTSSPAQDPDGGERWARPGVFEFRVAPGPELYYEVRSLAAQPDAPVPTDFAEAVAQVREIQTFLATPLSWPVVDGAFTAVDVPGQFAIGLSNRVLPPPEHMAEGIKRIRVANAAARLAAHLDTLAPKWLEEHWPSRRDALEARARELTELFPTDVQWRMAGELNEQLGIKSTDWVVPVKLVSQLAGAPSGSFLEASGSMASFLATQDLALSIVAEHAVYEIMHSLNAQPFYPASMPETMLKKFRKAKIEVGLGNAARNKLMRLCAANLMRQFVDPSHSDAGLATGDYTRRPKLHALEESLWVQFCAGDILRPELVDTLCLALGSGWDEKRP
ncbi:MAG TPA: hypothetical protein EYQ74_09745 [Planctomycetes bacterium]|nr:hypothetical protein [Planctomycetota bacterium]HIK60613.1 hypothetical protein [Planctomycetota bacterium]